jgi:hypothetical protein
MVIPPSRASEPSLLRLKMLLKGSCQQWVPLLARSSAPEPTCSTSTSHPPTLGSIVQEPAEQREALHTRNEKGG